MYKLIKRAIFLFYRYYSTGGKRSIPFQSALFAMTFLISIHILQIKLLFFGKGGLKLGDNKVEKLMWTFLFMLPIYIILAFLFKKNEIKNIRDDADIKKQYILPWSYVILTFLSLTLLVLWRSNII